MKNRRVLDNEKK